MMSPSMSVSPVESPTQQAGNAGVPPSPAHVAPNAAAVGPLEESSGQQDPDSSGRRPTQRLGDLLGSQREGSPDQVSPHDSGSGSRGPRPVQRRPMDAVGGQRDQDGPDLLSPSSGSRRPAQGRPGAAPARHWLPEVVGFCFLSLNSAMAAYRSWGDAGAIYSVASTYFTIISLYIAVKLFQAAPPNSRRRHGLMGSIWILTMSLNFGFVYQIMGTDAKPTLQLALLLWAIPAATGVSVYILFYGRSGAPLGEELLPY